MNVHEVSLLNQINNLKSELQSIQLSQDEERWQAKECWEKIRQELEKQKMLICTFKDNTMTGRCLNLMFKMSKKMKELRNAQEEADTRAQMLTKEQEALREENQELRSLLAEQRTAITELQRQAAGSKEKQLDFKMTEHLQDYEEQ